MAQYTRDRGTLILGQTYVGPASSIDFWLASGRAEVRLVLPFERPRNRLEQLLLTSTDPAGVLPEASIAAVWQDGRRWRISLDQPRYRWHEAERALALTAVGRETAWKMAPA